MRKEGWGRPGSALGLLATDVSEQASSEQINEWCIFMKNIALFEKRMGWGENSTGFFGGFAELFVTKSYF